MGKEYFRKVIRGEWQERNGGMQADVRELINVKERKEGCGNGTQKYKLLESNKGEGVKVIEIRKG
jgi:hypothetical protein